MKTPSISIICLLLVLSAAATQAQIPEPKVSLIPIEQREMTDHYIEKTWTTQGWKLEIFNGQTVSTLPLSAGTLLYVAPGQRFFTVADPIKVKNKGTSAYKVELRDLNNQIIAKKQLPALQSDEADDEFIPASDGSGLIHRSAPTDRELYCVVYKRQGKDLVQLMKINQPNADNCRINWCPEQQMIVVSFEMSPRLMGVHTTFLKSYALTGGTRWQTSFQNQHVESELFVSPLDGTIAFVARPPQDTLKTLFIYQKNGALARQIPVYRGGLYQRSHYQMVDGQQYLVSPSDGEFFYIINTTTGAIVGPAKQNQPGSVVTGVVLYQGRTVSSSFRGTYQPAANNTREFVLQERSLGVQDQQGNLTYLPLDLQGMPFLISTERGLFLREQHGEGLDQTNHYYRVDLEMH